MDESVLLENNLDCLPKKCSYNYQIESSGIIMCEYHVDMYPTLLNYIDETNKKYGRNLSVHKGENERPLLIFGQDESTYHQLIFSKKYWKGPAGMKFIIPKGCEDVLIISGFQSREYSLELGEVLTPETIKLINIRRRGGKYRVTEDARLLFSTDLKYDLTGDPTLRYFRVEINNDGYWNNSYSNIQLEDVIDCLSILFPNFDYLFLHDQSSENIQVREDVLVVSNMDVTYGGSLSAIHKTTVE